MKASIRTSVLGCVCSALVGGAAHGSLIWYGDPGQGLGVFKAINLEDANGNGTSNPSPAGSSAGVISDQTFGQVFQFYKAASDTRSEAHGAAGFNPVIGSTYYLGWRFHINSAVEDHAVFQWKSYGSNITQNHPIMLAFKDGPLELRYYSPGDVSHTIWSTPSVAVNTWHSIVLKIVVSDQDSAGSVSFWFDGMPQTLSNGLTAYPGRTFDGDSVDPKWGIYGGDGTQVTDDVEDLRIGTSYNDVAPPFNGTFQLQNKASSMVLNNQGSVSNGTAITQWTVTTSPNLEWTLIPTSNGYYQLNSVKSGKDAVVQSASTANGAAIVQWSFGSSGDDQWRPVSNNDGTWTFYNLHSGLVLEDPGSSTSKTIPMDQWSAAGGDNQKWKLIAQ